jgi:hypothetical protein
MSSNRRVELHETLNHFSLKVRGSQNSPLRNKALNSKKLATARQRLGLRWPSTALALLASAQSARGLAQSKTWRTFGRFMESLGYAGFVPQKQGFVQ